MTEIAAVEHYLASHAVLREALEIPRQAPVSATLLARGEYNENFLFEHPVTRQRLLFRVNLGSQMHLEDQIGYEARALELLAESGRTPKVLYVDPSKSFRGHGVMVETWLPGRPLSYEADLQAAAGILADIHSVRVPADHGLVEPQRPLHAIIDECAALFSRYVEWQGARTALVGRLENWFLAAEAASLHDEPGSHIVNTEVNSGNFLINETSGPGPDAGIQAGSPLVEGACGISYLVDWEKPIIAPVEQDLAHFLVPTTTFWKTDSILDRSTIDSFVGRYCAAVDDRFDTEGISERLSAFMRVICLRGITWCAMALAQHESGERSVADAYTLAKIKAYLEESFLDLVERLYYS